MLLTLPETAHLLAVSRSTVERLVARGDLLGVRVAGSTRIRRGDLDAYIAALPTRAASDGRFSARASAGGAR